MTGEGTVVSQPETWEARHPAGVSGERSGAVRPGTAVLAVRERVAQEQRGVSEVDNGTDHASTWVIPELPFVMQLSMFVFTSAKSRHKSEEAVTG